MKDKDFNRLVESVKQFIQIKCGEMKPSRVFDVKLVSKVFYVICK